MAKKITELPATTTPTAADLVPVVQGGATEKITRGNFLKNVDADATLTDITTNDVSTTKHGFVPKAPNDATKFLDGTGVFDTVKDSDLSTSDITTNDASTSKHGFLKKLDNNAAHFMDGQGNWSTPAGVSDASALTYTPADTSKWDGSVDPGNTDDALDQLADRVKDIEGGAVGGSDGDAIHDNISGEINAITEKVTPDDDDLAIIEDSAASFAKKKIKLVNLPGGGGGSGGANHAYYTYLAAQIEPLAIEKLQSGSFSYAIGSSTTKLVINAFNTRLGSGGRWEVRDPRRPVPLRGVTLTGLGASSSGIIIDPSAPTYSDAYTTYFDRLNTLATTAPIYLQQSTAGSRSLFLPGPYGNIITSVNVFDATWTILRASNTSSGIGWNLHDEVGDAGAQAVRFAHPVLIPVSKYVCVVMELGTISSQGGADAEGSITYVILPASWGKVTDSNTYIFRDDFLGTSLDTTTNWTRAQSTAGNVEIDTNFGWLKLKGDGTWGDNGCFSQTTTARASGKVFLADVYVPLEGSATTHNVVVGWHDGAGQSFSDFAHGLDFTASGGVRRLEVFENGNDRGLVGTNPGYTEGYIYRVRITLGSSNNATYEIQGGTEYGALGGSSWTDITPGTTSSSTTPLAIGATRQSTGNALYYIGDMRMYS